MARLLAFFTLLKSFELDIFSTGISLFIKINSLDFKLSVVAP